MKKTSFFNSLPFKLLVAVILGIIAGLILNRYSTNGISMAVLNITVTIKYILGQLITFCVPLIVLGFIAPSITRLGKNASLMLGVAVVLAYGSSVGAALFSTASGFLIIPHLSIHSYAAGLKRLPEVIFELEIPQIMSVMSALVFAMMLGLAATWTRAKLITGLLDEFQKIVEYIKEHISSDVTFEYYDTICRQVANRIPNIRKFAASHDLVFFVSGKKSSNGKILFNECKKVNPNSHLIDSAEEIDNRLLIGTESIGICGATSTPKWLMEEISKAIKSRI